jgi:hypothetical protein
MKNGPSEKLTVAQLNSYLYGPESVSKYSQDLATGAYPEPNESSLHTATVTFNKNINTILACT